MYQQGNPVSINEQIVSDGLARVSKATEVEALCTNMINSDNLSSLANELRIAENVARKYHAGIWRYGDVGDDDEEEY